MPRSLLPRRRLFDALMPAVQAGRMVMEVIHDRVAGLDVHKATVVACVRSMEGRKVQRECRTFDTTTEGLSGLLAWLAACGCTPVAMEATGVYWTPVWQILSDGAFELIAPMRRISRPSRAARPT
jgi:hypothetical protein